MKLSVLSMFTAFALILSYVESFIPVVGIPGARIGLANIAIIIVLYTVGVKEAMIVNAVRILLAGFMFGNLFSIFYSFAGAIFSIVGMYLLKKTDKFNISSVSIIGGVFHNIGQLIVASIVVKTYSIIYYIPILIIFGLVTGIAIGIVSNIIMKRTATILSRVD